MESLHQKLGYQAMVRLAELGVEAIPQFDPYMDKLQNLETLPIMGEEPEVTPEWGDQYLHAEITLKREQDG